MGVAARAGLTPARDKERLSPRAGEGRTQSFGLTGAPLALASLPPFGDTHQVNAVSPELDAKLARIELNGLKSAAGELQLDGDPETMLRTLAFIQGRITTLRGHAKRRIAKNALAEDAR